jgi:hypothetical protein
MSPIVYIFVKCYGNRCSVRMVTEIQEHSIEMRSSLSVTQENAFDLHSVGRVP